VIKKVMDKFGICVSALCLVHCLLTPVVLILFPSLASTMIEDEKIHMIFAAFVIFSVIIAVYPQCRKHGHKDIIALALGGVILIVLSFALDDILGHAVHAHPSGHAAHSTSGGHIILTITGSILLIAAHIKNIKVRHGKCESHETKISCSHQ
jgi:uncharacterized membrane protein